MLDVAAGSFRLRFWVVLALLTAPAVLLAQTDQRQLFAEGNDAFKSGRYETALAKYRAARDTGMHSSLLYYNLGVTHYKLLNYSLAESAFERATEDPNLTAVAYYNLGLTHKAAGDVISARAWFEAAWEETDSEGLKQLATKAIVSLNVEQQKRASNWREPQSYDGTFDFFVATRVGMDDNVFRSPSEPYIDFSSGTPVAVIPVVQEGEFVHLDVKARARYPSSKRSGTIFTFKYRGVADYYVDPEQSNANEYSQRFSFDAVMPVGDSLKSSKVFTNYMFLGSNREINFDPDNGLGRISGGEDLSDRWNYSNFGLTTGFNHRFTKLGYGIDARVELRDYDEVLNVADYDYEQFLGGVYGLYEFARNAYFELGAQYYIREYQERVARDLNGDLISNNPFLEYTYMAAEAVLKYRLNNAFKIRASYRRTRRDDNFEGYADYTKDRYGLVLTIAPGRRFRMDLAGLYREYDFDNAFAFHDPAGGPLYIDGIEGELMLQYRFTKHWAVTAQVEYRDITSTDTRNQYERMRSLLGVKWEI